MSNRWRRIVIEHLLKAPAAALCVVTGANGLPVPGVYPRFLDNISDEGLAQDAQAWYKEEVRV